MYISTAEFDELLPRYLAGELSDAELDAVELWRIASVENEKHFTDSLKAWESMTLLHEMGQFNSFEALKKVNERISTSPKSGSGFAWWAAAAVLLVLLGYAGFITQENWMLKQRSGMNEVVQTITSRQGMVTKFALADGTRVWLNSNSEIQFPNHFSAGERVVRIKGEAFFEVSKHKDWPFRVKADGLNIEVLGTSFDVSNYTDEKRSEVILVEGEVRLNPIAGNSGKAQEVMHPGQMGVHNESTGEIRMVNVNVDKYIAWKEGNLMFRDDKMEDVVKRLSRWFNVEIIISDPEIRSYIYNASFRNENLLQVLNLLKMSAPIDFRITERKALSDGEFTKQKVYLMMKKG